VGHFSLLYPDPILILIRVYNTVATVPIWRTVVSAQPTIFSAKPCSKNVGKSTISVSYPHCFNAFSPQKKASSTSKHDNFLLFYFFLSFLPFWILIRIQPFLIRIRIRNPASYIADTIGLSREAICPLSWPVSGSVFHTSTTGNLPCLSY